MPKLKAIYFWILSLLVLTFVGAAVAFLVVFYWPKLFVNSGLEVSKPAQSSATKSLVSANIDDQKTEPSLTDLYGEYASLTIPGISQIQLDSSNIKIESELAAGSNYKQYLASYTSQGYKVNGLLTIPNDVSKKYPAVVFVHGYVPPSIYRTTQKYADYVDFLARNDLIVFKIDLRGHGQSEGEANGAYYSNEYVLDVLNAVQSLATLPQVNKDKIGLWGHSMAGNVVTRAAAVNPQISAVVIWAGAVYTYTDLDEFGISDASYRRSEITDERRQKREALFNAVGRVSPDNPFWKLVSPVSYLQDFSGKIQVHHANNDTVVSVEYSRNLEKLLKDNPNFEYHEYMFGGHNLTGLTFTQAMRRSVDAFTN